MKQALLKFTEVVRRGKWLILGVFVLVFLGTVAFLMTAEPRYSASTLLLIDVQPTSSPNDALSYGVIDGARLENRNLANQVVILRQSLVIAERTADRLLEVHEEAPLAMLAASEGTAVSRSQLARMLQEQYISVELGDEETDFIRVSAVSSVPSEAALVANLYTEEYVKRTQATSRERIMESKRFLEDQIQKYQEELKQLEAQISRIGQEGALALDAEAERSISQLAELEAMLDEAHIQRTMDEAYLRSLEQELHQLQPRLTQRIASNVEREIEAAQAKIAELEIYASQIYIRNPALRADPSGSQELQQIQEQISALRSRVGTLSEQYVNEVLALGGVDLKKAGMNYVVELNRQATEKRIAISGTNAKIAALERRVADYSQKLDEIPQQSMRLAQLQRAQQSTEELYMRLVEKLHEANLANESEIGFARIIRPAITPNEPVYPNRVRSLAVGFLLALILGTLAAIARYNLDATVHTPNDLERLGFTLSGVIPDVRPLIPKRYRKKATVEIGGREVSTALAPLLLPRSFATDAYRRLYHNLQFIRSDKVVETVLITSPEAEAGKSTTAVNLALVAARTGRRTLIVDADMRRPKIHELLGLTPRLHLEDVLRSTDFDPEQFATGIPNVYAITAQESDAEPSELLASKEMRHRIETFRAHFDLVVFDSPPALIATDALLLATQCDISLIVVAADRTSSDALLHVHKELQSVGSPLVSAVLNRFDPRHIYGYRDTYGYRHRASYAYSMG